MKKNIPNNLKSMTQVGLILGRSRNEIYKFLRKLNIVVGRKAKEEFVNKGFFENHIWATATNGRGKRKYSCLYATVSGVEMLVKLYRLLNADNTTTATN